MTERKYKCPCGGEFDVPIQDPPIGSRLVSYLGRCRHYCPFCKKELMGMRKEGDD